MRKPLLLIMLLLIFSTIYAEPVWTNDVAIREVNYIDWQRNAVKNVNNEVFLTWSQSEDGINNLYVQKTDFSGSPQWQEPLVIKAGGVQFNQVKQLVTSDGNIIITWLEEDNSVSSLFVQKYTPAGDLLWGPQGINLSSLRVIDSFEYRIAVNNIGGFLLLLRNDSLSQINLQSYDASCLPVWDNSDLNINLDHPELDDLVADGLGGAIIKFRRFSSVNGINYLRRFANDGALIWATSYTLSNGEIRYPHQLFLNPNGILYDLGFAYRNDSIINIRTYNALAEQINQPLATYQLVLAGETNIENCNLKAVTTNGGDLQIGLLRNTINNDCEIFTYRFNQNLQPRYPVNGLVLSNALYAIDNFDLAVNNDEVAFIWAEYNEATGSILKMERTNIQGSQYGYIYGYNLDQLSGVYDSPQLLYQNNQMLVISKKTIDEYLKLSTDFYTITTKEGKDPQRTDLVSLINGSATLLANIPLADRSMLFYSDSRGGEYHLYCQGISLTGQLLFPENGKLINLGQLDYNSYKIFKINSEQIGLLHYSNALYLQIISENGDFLLNGNGILISSAQLTRYNATCYEDDIYISWVEPSSIYSNSCIYGQRIHNGTKMWGETGIMLKDLISSPYGYAFTGRYLLWKETVAGNNTILCLKYDENGYPDADWNASGEIVINNLPTNQYSIVASYITGEDLVLLIAEYVIHPVFFQKVTANHTLPWGDEGITFPATFFQLNYKYKADKLYLLYTARDSGSSSYNVFFQVIDSGGNFLYPEMGLQVNTLAPGNDVSWSDSYANYPTLCVFDNNSCLTVWGSRMSRTDGQDLYYRRINADGNFVESEDQLLCNAPYDQIYPLISTIGNQAIIGWQDRRMSHYTNCYGIYAQRIDAYGSSLPPEITPEVVLFKSCYPNPFSKSTNIVWEQKNHSRVSINIYNLKGQLVKSLTPSSMALGEHNIVWNSDDEKGKTVGNGIYFIRLQYEDKVITRKVMHLK